MYMKTTKYTTLTQEGKLTNKQTKQWSILKSGLDQTNDSEIIHRELGNEIITDNKEKANIVNTFFTDVTNLNDENAKRIR